MSIIGASAKASVDRTIDENFIGSYVVGSAFGQPFSPQIATRIAKVPGVTQVVKQRYAFIEADGHRSTLTGVLLWARVAASRRGGREVDCLAGDTRAWAPVYVPLPVPRPVAPGDHVRLSLGRTTSDDGVHPDYDLTVDGHPAWHAPHHGGPFRATPFYRQLFHSSGEA